jgi:hypothetical protein
MEGGKEGGEKKKAGGKKLCPLLSSLPLSLSPLPPLPPSLLYLKVDVPEIDWYSKQREALGAEDFLYAWMEVAGAEVVYQHGFDESGIDGVATMNQWVMVAKEGSMKIVYIECGGLLVDGTAEGVAAHVKKTWLRGQAAVALVRDKLGPELADKHVPLRKGGVNYLKTGATMHDTCNTANKSAVYLADLKEAAGIETYGAERWAEMPEEDTTMLDHLCGNHTRNLPIDAFNRLFQDFLEKNYGDDFAECEGKSGKHARLEKCGKLFLRSVCKLAYEGRGSYEKGDGLDIKEWLDTAYPDYDWKGPGRVELSKRQDWVLEVAFKIFPVLSPLYEYLVKETSALGPNVLRDSTAQKIENMQFEAYAHVCSTMWAVGFDELRMLTNDKDVALNPMELNELYESLHKVGTLLQGPPPPPLRPRPLPHLPHCPPSLSQT